MNEILSEGKLRSKVNYLRQELGQKDRELKKIFRDLALHKNNSTELKEQRDLLNQQVKQLAGLAAMLRGNRDVSNKQIAVIKRRRELLKKPAQEQKKILDGLRDERDKLNNISKGKYETLLRFYSEELTTFKISDIPLEQEIDVFNRLIALGVRITVAEQANRKHQQLQQKHNSLRKVYQELDIIHQRIQNLADESQNYHEQLISTYQKIDTLRKESDEYHKKLIEVYAVVDPFRNRIDPLKRKIEQERKELDVYLEQLKDVQLKKDEIKEEKKHLQAKTRYQETGKMSIEDLRILMDHKELKL